MNEANTRANLIDPALKAAGWGDGEFTDGGVHGDAQSGGVAIASVMAPRDGVFFSGDQATQVLFDVAEALEAHDVILFGDGSIVGERAGGVIDGDLAGAPSGPSRSGGNVAGGFRRAAGFKTWIGYDDLTGRAGDDADCVQQGAGIAGGGGGEF